jgi:hypothetical protein
VAPAAAGCNDDPAARTRASAWTARLAAITFAVHLSGCMASPPSSLYDPERTSLDDVAIVLRRSPLRFMRIDPVDVAAGNDFEVTQRIERMFGSAVPVHLRPGTYELELFLDRSAIGDPPPAEGFVLRLRLESGRVYSIEWKSRSGTAAELLAALDAGELDEFDLVQVEAQEVGGGWTMAEWKDYWTRAAEDFRRDWKFTLYRVWLEEPKSVAQAAREDVRWERMGKTLYGRMLLPYQQEMWRPYVEGSR